MEVAGEAMSVKDGGSAFPKQPTMKMPHGVELVTEQGGMTLRDYFAAVALPIAWALECAAPTGPYSEQMEPTYKGAAIRAYYLADAMLAERAK